MDHTGILFFLCLCILVLCGIVLYQRFVFRTGTQAKLRSIHKKLREIADTDSDERIMVFTDNQELRELAAQINRLLEERLKIRADYRRSEMTSRKMLSNISHDMKTPMTVVLGYLEIMRLGGEASPEMLKKTEQKAQGVMELINQFFTLAKIEAGDMDLKLARIDLCEICRESILDFYEILSNAEFQVEIRLPEQPVWVQGDPEALQRVLFNLVSNGVRYGSDGKYLGVCLRTDEKNAYVDVVDRGQGIEEFYAEHVFDRLFTMEDSRSSSIQGNGLGLTIARNLARQMGGDLTLESTPHVKTTFTVSLKRMRY
ncbi:MAG: HAMP domain-containing histidine kinase [Lachnospiraceae bacterium]|jgi:signal transduction histidine kinase|nr:HAMP domain-containing histidine kinase [Lachnospiraceae bacterium]